MGVWLTVIGVNSTHSPVFLQWLQTVKCVTQNVDVFLRIAPVISIFPQRFYVAPNMMHYCLQRYIELAITYPNIRGVDLIRGLSNFRMNAYNAFETYLQNVNNDYIHPAWDLWYMEIPEYTSLIQWLPQEMLEDITQLTTQPAHPSTFV